VSGPALADTVAPFEQTELDRALPAVQENAGAYQRIPAERMPFEQSELDRGVIGEPEKVLLASLGNTPYRSAEGPESPWANDHNFIAPAP
jgi:hypothetical protein